MPAWTPRYCWGRSTNLTERAHRVRALAEARRVLRPGGPTFVVGVSRFASLLDGLRESYFDEPSFARS